MQPLLRLLDRTWRNTLGAQPSTPRETGFLERYGKRLQAELDALRSAPEPGVSLDAFWSGFKAIAAELGKELKVFFASRTIQTTISTRRLSLHGGIAAAAVSDFAPREIKKCRLHRRFCWDGTDYSGLAPGGNWKPRQHQPQACIIQQDSCACARTSSSQRVAQGQLLGFC